MRRFGQSCARLYPFLGRTICTPEGSGRLLQVFPDRATVLLETQQDRASFFLPAELWPPGSSPAPGRLTEQGVH